jgi:heme exporter protein B
MNAFRALLMRDMKLAFRAGGGATLAAAFFALIATLVPFGVGAEQLLLGRIAGGVLWVSAALAALLSLDRLFQADYEDGSLDVLVLSPLSLELAATAKILAHWLTTGLPLVLLSPVLGLLLNLPTPGYLPLFISLLIGTPALSAVGAIGAALTISIRRGGLILALIVLPLLTPTLIFGAGAVMGALDGTGRGAFLFLAAFSVAAVALSPFAAAASVRLNIAG